MNYFWIKQTCTTKPDIFKPTATCIKVLKFQNDLNTFTAKSPSLGVFVISQKMAQ